jgi:hypothetical protein
MQQLSSLANLRHLSFTSDSIEDSYDGYSTAQQEQEDQAQGCALRVPELLEQLAVPSALMVPQPSLLQVCGCCHPRNMERMLLLLLLLLLLLMV